MFDSLLPIRNSIVLPTLTLIFGLLFVGPNK
jgi:hypothetical protein